MGDKGKRLTSPSDSKHRDPASIHFPSTRRFSARGSLRLLRNIWFWSPRGGSAVTSSFNVSPRPDFSPVETACTSTSLTILCYCVVNFNTRYVPTLSPSFSHLAGDSWSREMRLVSSRKWSNLWRRLGTFSFETITVTRLFSRNPHVGVIEIAEYIILFFKFSNDDCTDWLKWYR